MDFWEKVKCYIETKEPQYLDREDLEQVFPHKGIALVASCGLIENGACTFFIEPNRFHFYLRGHPWYFPGHWLTEIAAQVAGIQIVVALSDKLGEDAKKYSLSSLLKTGDWADRPLNTDIKSHTTISVTVVPEKFSFRLRQNSGFVIYEAAVMFRQGEQSAEYDGIKVMLSEHRG